MRVLVCISRIPHSFPKSKSSICWSRSFSSLNPGGRREKMPFSSTSNSNKKKNPSRKVFRPNCRNTISDSQSSEDYEDWISTASPYDVLGVLPSCSLTDLKQAFRARVKEFHPDVCKDARGSNAMIRRVIQAYEVLSKYHGSETTERESSDPFEEPECEAFDLFVNQALCVGKGCPYSCVKRAPHAFSFDSLNDTARAISQGHDEDYQIQFAVGQCPRSCIYYVTPSQRVILEELLDSVMNFPYNSADASLLYSLLAKAKFENNRYQKPKKQPKVSTQHVDWR
ncbi:chaperone DnaJ-domain superfamily protein [Tasmannia lanceolata]|uniref:chaperone DnaJ-domain superfamily protein n=1 Tax=Tasmannia lanceolata TaxID=3420 RepID=UPI0040646D27